MHLVERFTPIDADTIAYEFTVDNPTTFSKPWSVAMPMRRTDGLLYEYACHEGNRGLPGILAQRGLKRPRRQARHKDRGSVTLIWTGGRARQRRYSCAGTFVRPEEIVDAAVGTSNQELIAGRLMRIQRPPVLWPVRHSKYGSRRSCPRDTRTPKAADQAASAAPRRSTVS